MTLFLTSHTGGYRKEMGKRVPRPLLDDNGLTQALAARWKNNARVLIVVSDPGDHEKNDSLQQVFCKALPMSGLTVSGVFVWDDRSGAGPRSLDAFDAVILSGGHVPTQNAFFHRIGLAALLKDYSGVVIGISAGSMNAAETVYAQPELTGEAVDPCYARFLPGLGLTKRSILPHYQAIREDLLDGLRLFEDITYPDSVGREFLALPDGSYILSENGREWLCGEAWRIADGVLTRICSKNQRILL